MRNVRERWGDIVKDQSPIFFIIISTLLAIVMMVYQMKDSGDLLNDNLYKMVVLNVDFCIILMKLLYKHLEHQWPKNNFIIDQRDNCTQKYLSNAQVGELLYVETDWFKCNSNFTWQPRYFTYYSQSNITGAGKKQREQRSNTVTLIYDNGMEQPANFLSQEYQQFCYFTFLKLVQNVIELAFPFVLNNTTETLVERDFRRSQNQDEKLSFKLKRYIQRFYYALRIVKPLVGIGILFSLNENIWPDFSFQLPIDHRHSIITDKKDQIYADAYLAYVKLYANTGIEAAYLLLEQFDQLWDFCAEIESNSSNLNYYKTKGGAICNFLLSSFEFYFFFTYAITEGTSNADEDISFQDFIFISIQKYYTYINQLQNGVQLMFIGGLCNLCQAYTLSQEVEGGRSLIQEDKIFHY